MSQHRLRRVDLHPARRRSRITHVFRRDTTLVVLQSCFCVCFLRPPLRLCVSVVTASIPRTKKRRLLREARSELRGSWVFTTEAQRHRGGRRARRSPTEKI